MSMVLACLSLRLKYEKMPLLKLQAESSCHTPQLLQISFFEGKSGQSVVLTRSLLQTLAQPDRGDEPWSPSRSKHARGVHGGSSTTPHTRQHSNLSLYCSPTHPPGCCRPLALCFYSRCKTCKQENAQLIYQTGNLAKHSGHKGYDVCTFTHLCFRRYVSSVSRRQALSMTTTSSLHTWDISSHTSIQLPLRINTQLLQQRHERILSEGIRLLKRLFPSLNICNNQTIKNMIQSDVTHPKGFGLCVSKECNWHRLFFLLFGMASIMSFNFDLFINLNNKEVQL